VALNTEGRVHLVDGDNVEIFPAFALIRLAAYIQSQYCAWRAVRLCAGVGQLLLLPHLSAHLASATFSDADHAANIAQQRGDRAGRVGGSRGSGHDALQFEKFPTQGRVAKIK